MGLPASISANWHSAHSSPWILIKQPGGAHSRCEACHTHIIRVLKWSWPCAEGPSPVWKWRGPCGLRQAIWASLGKYHFDSWIKK